MRTMRRILARLPIWFVIPEGNLRSSFLPKHCRRHLALAVCLLLAAAAQLHAQKVEGCPWLNAATAAGVLGSEVHMSVTNTAKSSAELLNGATPDTTCEFTSLHGSPAATLRIVVRTSLDRSKEYSTLIATCGSPTRRIVGVGNEAVGCSAKKGSVVTEQIVARVRQRAFVVSLSKPGSGAGSEEDQALLDKLQNTAEQIAGSLF
jgi:hypothetical protein